ncbi:MAG: ACP S-malonyltransferase [Candidatus Muirbacterium halophilum]|nr:ACP S-malonyltransferase [Candidatus Muirbacterium halophilum]MCK9477033.1 ACP S-malonyltransferase [Candidatus Muirbacterium halophilum]
MKIAFVFPGQGSQYPGMAKDLYEKYSEAKKVFDKASQVLGFSLSEKCFYGTEEELRQTYITQPAILTHSLAVFEILKNKIDFAGCAGHSLGEYSALYASNSVNLNDVLGLVKKRGEAMSEISGGVLAALIGKDFSRVEELCKASGFVISIYNSPKQIILAGRDEDFENLEKIAGDYGIRRVKKLQVSGPFHSFLMEPAAKKFKNSTDKVIINTPDKALYMNCTANSENNTEEIRKNMVNQVYKTVRWKDEIENMIKDGFDTFIELGPGKVLCGIISSIDNNVKVMNVDNAQDLENILEILNGGENAEK